MKAKSIGIGSKSISKYHVNRGFVCYENVAPLCIKLLVQALYSSVQLQVEQCFIYTLFTWDFQIDLEPIPISLAVMWTQAKSVKSIPNRFGLNLLESRFEIDLEPIWGYKSSCECFSDLKSLWLNVFLFITPVIIIRFASSLSQLTSTEKDDFRTFYRIQMEPKVPEIFNFKDIKYKNRI